MAIDYATQQHAGQVRRVDGAPFIQHPLEVASLLHDAGAPDHVIAAGVLHDTIDKTGASSSDLRERFGSPVEMLVLAVSEDERIPGYQARKAALRQQVATAGRDALMVCSPPTRSQEPASWISSSQPIASRSRNVHERSG
jgi:(p)ppGpp synthase/HD superfamily hydrolase